MAQISQSTFTIITIIAMHKRTGIDVVRLAATDTKPFKVKTIFVLEFNS
jgi:hypothetical protein